MLRELNRLINIVVLHCSDSNDADSLYRRSGAELITQTPVQAIDEWHRARGFRRSPSARERFNPDLTSIGYHLVIYRNGAIATGRAFSEIGAHVEGHNAHSLGICLIGRERFTADQWRSLANVVGDLGRTFKRAVAPLPPEGYEIETQAGMPLWICGHRQLNRGKTCPNFDVPSWLDGGMTPDPAHVWAEA